MLGGCAFSALGQVSDGRVGVLASELVSERIRGAQRLEEVFAGHNPREKLPQRDFYCPSRFPGEGRDCRDPWDIEHVRPLTSPDPVTKITSWDTGIAQKPDGTGSNSQETIRSSLIYVRGRLETRPRFAANTSQYTPSSVGGWAGHLRDVRARLVNDASFQKLRRHRPVLRFQRYRQALEAQGINPALPFADERRRAA